MLRLLDAQGGEVPYPIDASMGFVELSRWVRFACSQRSRDVLWSSLAIPIGASLYAYRESVTEVSELSGQSQVFFFIAPLIILILLLLIGACRRMPPTRLQQALIEYCARLQGRGYIPVSCERGPGRAMAARKILEL